jgi:hypothetical protein
LGLFLAFLRDGVAYGFLIYGVFEGNIAVADFFDVFLNFVVFEYHLGADFEGRRVHLRAARAHKRLPRLCGRTGRKRRRRNRSEGGTLRIRVQKRALHVYRSGFGAHGQDRSLVRDTRKAESGEAARLCPDPAGRKNPSDALARYEMLCRFKKESGQFGAMRQANESKAVAVALDNLAITTGYGDADRMTWALEGQKTERLRPLMEPHVVDDVTLRLVIGKDGTPSVETLKKGKPLKAVPKEFAKDEYVADLKAAAKSLKEQRNRARLKFEMAMMVRAAFGASEIAGLLQNPVLSGTVSSLVFLSGDMLGFPALENGGLSLKSPDGAVRPMLAVLPVHSQHRGRVFLPFADEDPKTAEIMSKILLFATDQTIKDPGILSQMGG